MIWNILKQRLLCISVSHSRCVLPVHSSAFRSAADRDRVAAAHSQRASSLLWNTVIHSHTGDRILDQISQQRGFNLLNTHKEVKEYGKYTGLQPNKNMECESRDPQLSKRGHLPTSMNLSFAKMKYQVVERFQINSTLEMGTRRDSSRRDGTGLKRHTRRRRLCLIWQ